MNDNKSLVRIKNNRDKTRLKMRRSFLNEFTRYVSSIL